MIHQVFTYKYMHCVEEKTPQRGKNSMKSKKITNVNKPISIFLPSPILLLVLVFYSVSTGTYFISFDNTKMNLDVIEI